MDEEQEEKEEKVIESYCEQQCDVSVNWHDRDCPHEGEVALLEKEIKQLTAETMVLKSRLNPDRKVQCDGCGHWTPIGPTTEAESSKKKITAYKITLAGESDGAWIGIHPLRQAMEWLEETMEQSNDYSYTIEPYETTEEELNALPEFEGF